MSEPSEPATGMTFFDHLGELRRRLTYSFIALFLGFAVCYPFAADLFKFMQRPLHEADPDVVLNYIRLSEPFFVHLKVAALAGLFVALPFVMLQVWWFVAPGMYRSEKRYVIPFVLLSSGCFAFGGWFAFSILFPAICRFFLEQGAGYGMTVTLERYFSDLSWTVLGVAGTFELPVVIGLLARIGVVDAPMLLRGFHFAIVGCLIVSALVTPTPDALTMLFVAVPMIGLYGLGILIAKLVAPAPPTLHVQDSSSDPD